MSHITLTDREFVDAIRTHLEGPAGVCVRGGIDIGVQQALLTAHALARAVTTMSTRR